MLRLTSLFLVLISNHSALSLSLIKLNASQKVGLPSFMYSHLNISDVNEVSNVLQKFFSNIKDSISEYVEILSGPEEKRESSEDLETQIESPVVAEPPVATSPQDNAQGGGINKISKAEAPRQSVNAPQQDQQVVKNEQKQANQEVKDRPQQEQLTPQQHVETQQKKALPVVVESPKKNVKPEIKINQEENKLPKKDGKITQPSASTNLPKISDTQKQVDNKQKPIQNKINTAQPANPAPDSQKVEVKTNTNTNQKENVKSSVKPLEQKSNTESDTGLFSLEAKQAVEQLQTFLSHTERSQLEALQQTSTSTRVTQVLNQYLLAAESVQGSKCDVPQGEKTRSGDLRKTLEETFKICKGAGLGVNKGEPKDKVAEAVNKVKDSDYNLRLTSNLCASLKDSRSDVCEEAKRKYLDSIRSVASQKEIQKLSQMTAVTLQEAVKVVESCVEERSKDMQKDLISWTKRINDCRADVQEL